eukprot:5641580-Amphidinium_carterae.1
MARPRLQSVRKLQQIASGRGHANHFDAHPNALKLHGNAVSVQELVHCHSLLSCVPQGPESLNGLQNQSIFRVIVCCAFVQAYMKMLSNICV